jgi:hypothetical protein
LTCKALLQDRHEKIVTAEVKQMTAEKQIKRLEAELAELEGANKAAATRKAERLASIRAREAEESWNSMGARELLMGVINGEHTMSVPKAHHIPNAVRLLSEPKLGEAFPKRVRIVFSHANKSYRLKTLTCVYEEIGFDMNLHPGDLMLIKEFGKPSKVMTYRTWMEVSGGWPPIGQPQPAKKTRVDPEGAARFIPHAKARE